jgi:hypothetical protein
MAFAFVMKLGHANVATTNVTHHDAAHDLAIDRTIIIRVNACCAALSSERMQQNQ